MDAAFSASFKNCTCQLDVCMEAHPWPRGCVIKLQCALASTGMHSRYLLSSVAVRMVNWAFATSCLCAHSLGGHEVTKVLAPKPRAACTDILKLDPSTLWWKRFFMLIRLQTRMQVCRYFVCDVALMYALYSRSETWQRCRVRLSLEYYVHAVGCMHGRAGAALPKYECGGVVLGRVNTEPFDHLPRR